MTCPKCSRGPGRVLDTDQDGSRRTLPAELERAFATERRVLRLRVCGHCEHRWTTIEVGISGLLSRLTVRVVEHGGASRLAVRSRTARVRALLDEIDAL